MKITLIAHVMPYPPFQGVSIDIWRRLKAFADCGVKLQLISWIDHPPKPEELEEIQKYTQQIYLIPFKRTPVSLTRRIIDLFSYPLEVTSRIVRGKELSTLLAQVKAFYPDVIFLDGIHGGEVATYLSKTLNVPMVTRSHNIEYLYQQNLLVSSWGWNKLRKQLSLTNLESYEKNLLRNSIRFYDISIDDLRYWEEKQGLINGRWLPPLIDISENKTSDSLPKQPSNDFTYEIIFLGNLHSENNVAGVIWFLTEVMPAVRLQLPSVKVLIAGSAPVNKIIKQLCNETAGVDLEINPPSSAEVYSSGRILINPVSVGSGVSIKSIEMLASGKPIISRSQGLAGLPQELHQYFTIADNVESFVEKIVEYLSNPIKVNIEPKLLDSFFGSQVIKEVVSELEVLLRNNEAGENKD